MKNQLERELEELIRECRPEITEAALQDIVYEISHYVKALDNYTIKEREELLQVVRELRDHLEAIEMPTTKDEIRLQEIKNLEYKLSEIVLNNRK